MNFNAIGNRFLVSPFMSNEVMIIYIAFKGYQNKKSIRITDDISKFRFSKNSNSAFVKWPMKTSRYGRYANKLQVI